MFGCQWHMRFYNIHHPGEYKLEIFTIWLNELAEPSDSIRKRQKNERINDGQVVNLGGIGHHPYFVINATMSYHSFNGFVVKSRDAREVYMIVNDTKCQFGSWDFFLKLGFSPEDIKEIPSAMLAMFPNGPILEPSSSSLSTMSDESFQKIRATFPKPSGLTSAVIKQLGNYQPVTADSIARAEAKIFGIPQSIVVAATTEDYSDIYINRKLLPLCKAGDSTGDDVGLLAHIL